MNKALPIITAVSAIVSGCTSGDDAGGTIGAPEGPGPGVQDRFLRQHRYRPHVLLLRRHLGGHVHDAGHGVHVLRCPEGRLL